MTVDYQIVSHIIDRQYEAERAFLAEFAAGDYTVHKPLVKLNPYFYCPLTAIVLFRTAVATEVTIIVKGKEAAGDIKHTFPAEKEHILPIYGLYAGWDNRVELRTATGIVNEIIISTEPAIADAHAATKIDTTAEYMGDNFMFLTTAMDSMPVGYDYRGDIRWYASVNFNFDLKRMPNGHLLVGTERLVQMPYYTTGLYEMTFSGKIYKEYRSPIGGYHHDQFFMEDGNILMLTYEAGSPTVEDICILIDKNTGEVLRKWDYKDVLPQYPIAGSGSQDAEDWFHNNAVWYDKKTNSLTLSGRHQDAVINIDFDLDENGKCKLNWIIGDPTNWPEDMQKYFFKPVGNLENFDWQYEQHACLVTPTGDIMMFDNGHWRSKIKENYVAAKDNFSRGVRYHIDTDKMEIEQVWQYGKERGSEFFSPYICNVEYYDENHYMVHSGGIGYEDGKPCEGMAVILCMNPGEHVYTFNSITCEIVNDEVKYELHVPANCYRAEKLPVYYANETLELGKGQLLGSLKATTEASLHIKTKYSGEQIPEGYKMKVKEEIDRILVQGYFTENTMVQILLIGEQGETLRYSVETASKEFQAMCVGTFQKADNKEIDTFINKTGLAGNYELRIVVEEDDEYNEYLTGIIIQA